jgi:acyl-CoA synthetase (AMP-forming)/AMP-acid ligase II
VIDRKKNILKYKGYHINPSEIENEIQSMEGVEIVSVVGLPDLYLTNATAAAIVKTKDSKLTSDEVIEFIASKFPVYKQLHGGVYFFDKLPMTPSGKIIKRKVIEDILKVPKSP